MLPKKSKKSKLRKYENFEMLLSDLTEQTKAAGTLVCHCVQHLPILYLPIMMSFIQFNYESYNCGKGGNFIFHKDMLGHRAQHPFF